MIIKYKSEQKRKRKKKLILFFTSILLILVCFFSLYFHLKTTLKVTEIVIIGNQHLSKEDIKALMKISENDLLLTTSTKDIYKKIKKSPWVKDVRVRKELTGKIIIQVFEAAPFAILFLSKKPYFVDNNGIILEEVLLDHSMFFLPIIREIDPLNNPDTYKEAITLASLIKEKKIMINYGHVEITGDNPDELTLKIDELLIKVGSGDYEQKFKRLEKVKSDIMQRYSAIEYIDLRFSDQVIVKPLKR
ncbi:MAG: FtsQ-type POTRA domain-containing protein [Thermodesulfovibrionales bacterium]|nr:FtsQ-type POTRA domain-containing protein [Thermodesulfovibrionales bacterium]